MTVTAYLPGRRRSRAGLARPLLSVRVRLPAMRMAAPATGRPVYGRLEVAQTIFVTLKTVEKPLAGSCRKLGVQARAELGEALRAPDERAT